MSHRYFPHTAEDVGQMLLTCGVESLDELYADVPAQLRLKNGYNLGASLCEPEVQAYFEDVETKCQPLICFAGAGAYDHYCPAVIPSLTSRSEYLTAYTPYQPEISQGTLQYIFEYQSMMTELTGLEVSNASMYDGATATAEAMIMAVHAARRKNRVLISSTLNPEVIDVVKTYARYHGIVLDLIPSKDGVTDRTVLQQMLQSGDIAGVIVGTPNYYGIIEDLEGWANEIHSAKALLIINSPASPLAVLKPAGEWNADIAVGDAQSLGMPLNFGGPYLGYICTTKALMRKMPGRIVGATTDDKGHRTFVLTLQAREQHIRREKATSNICSNQGIMTLHAAIYMSLMGLQGLQKINQISSAAAHHLAKSLEETGKMALAYPDKPFLNEFAMKIQAPLSAFEVVAALKEKGILGGVVIDDNTILIAVTERRTPEQIDLYIQTIKDL